MTTAMTKSETPTMRRWFEGSPLAAIRREVDDVLENFFGRKGLVDWNAEMVPSIDLAETADSVEVKTDLPGYKPEEIMIDVDNNYLTISGKHKEEKKEEGNGKKFHRVERREGNFTRSIWLPCAVKEDKAKAQLKDGVLTVTLPKSEEAKRKKIPVTGV